MRERRSNVTHAGAAMTDVWAPRAQSVVLDISGARTPLDRSARGYWTTPTTVPAGRDYGFILDGDRLLPDPRSPFQPSGVHGASRAVDHSAFPWTDHAWQPPPLPSAVVYELHVGTFSEAGTFDAAIAKLDHLVDLGITHVELMPVCEFPGTRGWGYDGVDLFAPHHAYGGPDGLKRLVDACHARGLAVLVDVVYNHLGPAGNYLARFGPYFTDRYKTHWGEAVNLDGEGSDEVRRFFCDNALMWLRDYHADGLRIDAVHAFFDRSATHFLEQLASEVARLEAALGRHLVLVAESDLNDPRLVTPREAGGFGLHAQWSDDFHHALHTVLTGERGGYYEDFDGLTDLAAALERGIVYTGRYSPHRQRTHGRATPRVPPSRLVAAAQNHDQIGNRAKGDRLSQLVSPDRLKIAAALLLTAPFVPLLFQGEEWGASTPFQYFTDHEDEALGAAVREGRRREFAAFGWNPADIPDPQSPDTFGRSRLNWAERTGRPHADLLDWHRALIRLRREHGLSGGNEREHIRVIFDETANWLVVHRDSVIVACNLSDRPRDVPLRGAGALLLASGTGIDRGDETVRLPPDAVVIASADRDGDPT